jgi:hypothetical protein
VTTTVLDLITDSLRYMNILDQIQSPSAEQGNTALTVLNDLMADMEADGIRLGWYPQTSMGAVVPLQDCDIRGVKWCLASELAGYYGIPLTERQLATIDSTYTKLAKRAVKYFESDLTGLPFAQGSGYGCGRLS